MKGTDEKTHDWSKWIKFHFGCISLFPTPIGFLGEFPFSAEGTYWFPLEEFASDSPLRIFRLMPHSSLPSPGLRILREGFPSGARATKMN